MKTILVLSIGLVFSTNVFAFVEGPEACQPELCDLSEFPSLDLPDGVLPGVGAAAVGSGFIMAANNKGENIAKESAAVLSNDAGHLRGVPEAVDQVKRGRLLNPVQMLPDSLKADHFDFYGNNVSSIRVTTIDDGILSKRIQLIDHEIAQEHDQVRGNFRFAGPDKIDQLMEERARLIKQAQRAGLISSVEIPDFYKKTGTAPTHIESEIRRLRKEYSNGRNYVMVTREVDLGKVNAALIGKTAESLKTGIGSVRLAVDRHNYRLGNRYAIIGLALMVGGIGYGVASSVDLLEDTNPSTVSITQLEAEQANQ